MERLVGVMEKVTSDERRSEVWKEVLRWDPYSVPNEIYTKYTTAKEKAQALADIYVNSRPESSWQYLAKILYAEGELAAAKEAKAFLQQSGGYCNCTADLMITVGHQTFFRQIACMSYHLLDYLDTFPVQSM